MIGTRCSLILTFVIFTSYHIIRCSSEGSGEEETLISNIKLLINICHNYLYYMSYFISLTG